VRRTTPNDHEAAKAATASRYKEVEHGRTAQLWRPPRVVTSTTARIRRHVLGRISPRTATNLARRDLGVLVCSIGIRVRAASVFVCRTTGVKLRGPEGAQRPRATSASTSELDSVRSCCTARMHSLERFEAAIGTIQNQGLSTCHGECA
jgi:hypothetical protein